MGEHPIIGGALFGHISFMGHEYIIVNKECKDIFQLSAEAHKAGREKAIEPGEPCDLVIKTLMVAYRKLGRDRIIALIKEGKTEREIKALGNKKD